MTVDARPKLREDIQILRAIAVVMVVIFHFFPKALPGGYVGVDVFFAISGTLITTHLLKEVERTGTVSLARFWAQRARRLLPASLAVLGVTLALGQFLLPISAREDLAFDTAAASGYVLNLRLAKQAVDYMAQDSLPSPVQHYWSLSTEEQFYFVWPVLLAAALGIARKSRLSGKRTFLIGVVLVAVGSFLHSVAQTRFDRSSAYFLTTTRAFEFALGALLSFAPSCRLGPRVRATIAAASLGTILLSAFALNEKSAFPGYLALFPTLATVLLLWSGEPSHAIAPLRSLALRPALKLGEISYSVYLWHWPLLVIAQARLGRGLGLAESGAIIGATVMLSLASQRLVEDRVRYSEKLLSRGPGYTLGLAAVGMVFVLGGSFAALHAAKKATSVVDPVANQLKSSGVPCFGARISDANCDASRLPPRLVPEPFAAKRDHGKTCMTNNTSDELKRCKVGATKDSRRVAALVGDSHAAHFAPTLEIWGKKNGFEVRTLLKGSCPLSAARRASNERLQGSCERWKESVWRELESHPEIELVVLSGSSLNPFVANEGESTYEAAIRGYSTALARLNELGRKVLVLRDIPRPRSDVVRCLENLPDTPARLAKGACARPRGEALLRDPLADAAASSSEAKVIDFTPVFCDADECAPVVGNALVYRDPHHMTGTFARTLAPLFSSRYEKLFGDRPL